jgi:hypothetical protein
MIEVPLTEAQYAAAGQRLQSYGVNLSGPTGTLSRSGVTARYTYANEILTIEILEKPFFLPASAVESQIRGYIQKGLDELNRPA